MFCGNFKMAKSVSRKQAPFTYIWTIENVPKLIDVYIKSPLFVLDILGKEEWCLTIDIMSNFEIVCGLQSKNHQLKQPSGIVIEFSFIGADGSPFFTKKNKRHKSLVFMLKKEALLEQYAEFLSSDILTIRCRIWRKRFFSSRIKKSEFCYAKTRLKTNSGSILCAIEKFSTLKSSATDDFEDLAEDEIQVCSLKPFTPDGTSMDLIFFITNISKTDDAINAELLIDRGRGYKFACEISVMAINGDVIASKLEKCRAPFSSVNLDFSNLIKKSKLISCKDLFLPNDTLLLRCSVEVFCGIVSNEIEYCTPNSLTFNKSLNFEEYFIKEREENDFDYKSSRSLCPLKTAFRYLRSEVVLSDANLRIGTKLYPVHKNILSSRSSVFAAIFKNVKANIVEINDVDEDTLCRLLDYVYSDELRDLQMEDALNLFKAAVDYDLKNLKDLCSDFLMLNLSKHNFIDVLSLADKYADEKLKLGLSDFEVALNVDSIVDDSESM